MMIIAIYDEEKAAWHPLCNRAGELKILDNEDHAKSTIGALVKLGAKRENIYAGELFNKFVSEYEDDNAASI
jgi:hypothetical protein